MKELLVVESIKIIPTVVASAAGVLATWFVGQRIVTAWQIRQKRRELQLDAVAEFYRAYGEFYEIWKVWNYRVREGVADPSGELFSRAAAMEGRVEAILVRIASERRLSPRDVERLGLLRQAFQELREAIRRARAIKWNYSEHPKYLELKQLAAYAASLFGDGLWTRPTAEEAQAAVVAITANEHDARWRALEPGDEHTPSVERDEAI
jgi:hypothetical protein